MAVDMQSIGEFPVICTVCRWAGTVEDCIPDVDSGGSLGCPMCNAVIDARIDDETAVDK